jgi:hypothetical protein
MAQITEYGVVEREGGYCVINTRTDEEMGWWQTHERAQEAMSKICWGEAVQSDDLPE